MNDTPQPDIGETPEKDVPLRYDTRLLGRILGDTVRSQEGEQVFDLVERIRRTGVQFHRNADEDARRELQSIMSGLPTDESILIIRAFMGNLGESGPILATIGYKAWIEDTNEKAKQPYAIAMKNGAVLRGWGIIGF